MFTQNMRSHARPTNNAKKVRQWFSDMCVPQLLFGSKTAKFGPKLAFLVICIWFPKLLLPPVKIRIFGPKYGSYGAPLVGCLVVVVRGLYLARHLFALFHKIFQNIVHTWLRKARKLG